MRRLLTRVPSVLAAAAVAVPLVAGPAWGPKYILGASAYGDCLRDPDRVERFEGTLSVRSFSRAGATLLVTGLLSGTCATDAGEVTAVLPEVVATFPVLSVDAFCTPPDVGVMIRPGAQVSAYDSKTGAATPFAVDLTRGTVIERSWTTGDPAGLRGKLCALDRIADRRPLASLAPVLNAFVRV
ncbi:MAG TPA: hypothetical protein VF519_03415 [Mycobacteriales bacterium]